MAPYLIIFFLPVFFHFFLKNTHEQNKRYFTYLIIFIIFLFSVLRGDIGGDHKRYLLSFNELKFDLTHVFGLKQDLLFYYSNWIIKYFFGEFIYFKVFCGILFFLPLTIFIIKTKSFFLGLVIILPIGVYLIHLGYIKQSISVAFFFLIYLSIEKEKIYDAILLFVISYFFHISTLIIIFPIIFLIIFKLLKNFINIKLQKKLIILFYFIFLLFSIILIYLLKNYETNEYYLELLPERIYKLLKAYLINNIHYGKHMESPGFYYRFLPYIVAIFSSFFLIRHNIYNFSIYIFFIFLFLLCIILLFFNFTTIADRIHFYSIPFQILTFINLHKIFYDKFKKNLTEILVVLLYLFILMIWIQHSQFSINNWQPYHLGIFL